MRFESVRAHPFGPFHDETLSLAPGLNVVYGPNEAGKSTWHAALYAGLCGMRRRKGAPSAEDKQFRERHRPWDAGGAWAVSAVVTLEDGRRVELRQDLASKVDCSASDADLAGRDYANEITYEGAPDGSRWLGLNRRSFLGSACVRQAQVLRLLDDADALQEDLQRAAATAGADETAVRALDLLTDYRRAQVGSAQAPTKPLRTSRERVSTSRSALERAQRAQAEYLERSLDLEQLERQAEAHEQDTAVLRAALAGEAAADAEQRAARAAHLATRFPEGPPRRTGEDDGLAQQVSEALARWRARPDPRAPSGPTVATLERELLETTAPPAATDTAPPEPDRFAAPYLAAAGVAAGVGVAAGIALALADFLIPGLVAGGLGLGSLAWWWLTTRRQPEPAGESPAGVLAERRRLLRQQIENRLDADRRYEEDARRCEQAAAAVRGAAALAGTADRKPEAQVAALTDWQNRRREKLAETDRRSTEWDALQQALAGQELAQIQDEAVRLREEAASLAERVASAALAAVREASPERLAGAERETRTARDAYHNARGQLEQIAADLPSVADAEDALETARHELERVERLDRTLAATIEFLERAEERVHRDVAPVLRNTLLEWLPRVTGERYTDCKVDPDSLQVDVRSGHGPWRRAGLLSHGTAEQIYLLLRLALTRHLVAPGEVCPLILDDVVAACDADRKRVVLETLRAVGESTQVILFTHEEDVRAWARQRLAAPRNGLNELPRPR